mgnify:CR=1 FL=1
MVKNRYFQPINENGDYIDYWTLVNDINNLYEYIEELEKIRDNWNKLKEYINKTNKTLCWTNTYDDILDKMHELEQGDSNE